MELDCGIAYARLAQWLDDELALPRKAAGRWEFMSGNATCAIALEDLGRRTVGRTMALPRTHLAIDGDPAAIEVLQRLFTLRFMSAGG